MRKAILIVAALAAMAAGSAQACSDAMRDDLLRATRDEQRAAVRALTPGSTGVDYWVPQKYYNALKRLEDCDDEPRD